MSWPHGSEDSPFRDEPVPGVPQQGPQQDGSLTIRFLQVINAKRAERWHGLKSWSALEWAGAMAGEAGEACNAAKKLKRVEDQIANINLEEGRSLTDVESANLAIVNEIADTVIYGVLLAERVGCDLETAIRQKFNQKSEEYGFPERIPAALSASRIDPPVPQAPEVCICAAVQMPDGYIVRGHRHCDAMQTAGGIPRYATLRGLPQGFVTSLGRFVDRKEGARLQIAAGIESADRETPYLNGELYSEDLY